MKNTIENKAKFFALYLYQKVYKWNDSSPCDLLDHNKVNTNVIEESDKLQLKHITNITDRDVVRVWEMLKINPNEAGYDTSYNKLKEDFINEGCWALHNFDFYGWAFECVDLLRILGYAVPWNGITVEEQIEFGWVTIKHKINRL